VEIKLLKKSYIDYRGEYTLLYYNIVHHKKKNSLFDFGFLGNIQSGFLEQFYAQRSPLMVQHCCLCRYPLVLLKTSVLAVNSCLNYKYLQELKECAEFFFFFFFFPPLITKCIDV